MWKKKKIEEKLKKTGPVSKSPSKGMALKGLCVLYAAIASIRQQEWVKPQEKGNHSLLPQSSCCFLAFAAPTSNSEVYFLLHPWCWYFITLGISVYCSICSLLQYLKYLSPFMYCELLLPDFIWPPHCCFRKDYEQLLLMPWLMVLTKCWLTDQLSQMSCKKSMGNSSF